jgi:hypothetical protein
MLKRSPSDKLADMEPDRTTYVLRLRPLPGVDAARALRWALKGLLRQCGLQCVSVEEEPRDTQRPAS